MCFDKTGTLTEDGLDVLGVHVADNAPGRKEIVFGELSSDVKEMKSNAITSQSGYDSNNTKFLLAGMTTCHSLRLIENELLGDPLDNKMFEFTRWNFSEDQSGKSTVYSDEGSFTIVKEYEFVSTLRRMTVLATSSEHNLVFTKGAPEIMSDICIPGSLPQITKICSTTILIEGTE